MRVCFDHDVFVILTELLIISMDYEIFFYDVTKIENPREIGSFTFGMYVRIVVLFVLLYY